MNAKKADEKPEENVVKEVKEAEEVKEDKEVKEADQAKEDKKLKKVKEDKTVEEVKEVKEVKEDVVVPLQEDVDNAPELHFVTLEDGRIKQQVKYTGLIKSFVVSLSEVGIHKRKQENKNLWKKLYAESILPLVIDGPVDEQQQQQRLTWR